MFRDEKIVSAFIATAGSIGLAMMANAFGTVTQYVSAAAAGVLFLAAAKMFYCVLFENEEEKATKDC